MDDMVRHTQAVARGSQKAMLVADMPFLSYQVSPESAMANAGRLLKEGNAQAVKLEGGREHADIIHKMTYAGIPVMAHLGLTPQSVNQLGGYKVQGKQEDAAEIIMQDAKCLEEAGAFSLVLECVPEKLAADITAALSIPSIGIGAGVHCDGQVLVINDMLGMNDRMTPKFVKKYAQLNVDIKNAVKLYIKDVKTSAFPDDKHSFK
ncbi:MAG TPA: 3-methyl-2-oxobutanoate hydroxymethyltransferase, partial [Smithellaceae bacterium]|nr:3-methyl-2-oxobutanoate hydroxymethyltransferase [Smithellaceae bacterium]